MRIALFGATGLTGKELVQQALERGYEVNTLVRHPMAVTHPLLTATQGNIFDVDTVKRVTTGCNAVISVIGFTPKLFGEKATKLYSKSASVFIEAMNAVQVKKLIFCTSAGVEDDPHELYIYKYIAKPLLLQKGYTDMQLAEKAITNSSLDWVIVRPSRLTNGSLTEQFRISKRFRAKGGYSISRADVAFFILNQVTDNEWLHQTPTLTY